MYIKSVLTLALLLTGFESGAPVFIENKTRKQSPFAEQEAEKQAQSTWYRACEQSNEPKVKKAYEHYISFNNSKRRAP